MNGNEEQMQDEQGGGNAKNGLLKKVGIACAALCVAGAGAALWGKWYLLERTVPFAGNAAEVQVMVPPGAGTRTVAKLAHSAGLNISENAFVLAMRFAGDAAGLHAGRYKLQNGMTMREIVEKFSSGKVEQFTIRIPDGVTARQVRQIVESNPDIFVAKKDGGDGAILQAIGAEENHLEGLFAPDTYKFNSGVSDTAVYRAFYQRQKGILAALWEARSPNISTKIKTPYDALVLASIIEKETANPDDRAKVSSVFHNRLRVWMPLQTDPAVIYGIGEKFDGNLRKKDLTAPGPYNTYLNYGLTPTPISMPTKASIEAALNPARTDYLYFVARGDGTTQFSKELKQHNRAVYKYQIAPRKRASSK